MAWLPSDASNEKDDRKPSAGGSAENQPLKELQDLVAIAEKQLATKRAVVKVAECRMKIAEAKLKALGSKLTAAQAALSSADAELQRVKKLASKELVSDTELTKAEAARKAASALRDEAEANVEVGEEEVKLGTACHTLALAELEEAELRLKQLRERLK